MAKVLRFRDGGSLPTNLNFIDPPLHHGDIAFTLTNKWRSVTLPGDYTLPFSLSLEATKAPWNDDLTDNPPEAGSNEHIWIQISPIDDLQNWISISPKTILDMPAANQADIQNTWNNYGPAKMPTILVTDVPAGNTNPNDPMSAENWQSFSLSSYSHTDALLKYAFPTSTVDTKYKIRIVNHTGRHDWDHWALKGLAITPYINQENKTKTLVEQDNQIVRRQVPRSDTSYSWINNSAVTIVDSLDASKRFIDFSGYESPSKYDKKLSFLDSSEVGSYTFTLFVAGQGNLQYGRAFGINFDPITGQSAIVEDLESFLPTDFLNLNSHIVEPIDFTNNTMGYDSITFDNPLGSSRTVEVNYVNDLLLNPYNTPDVLSMDPTYVSSPEDTEGTSGLVSVLNSIILNRQGPYGWPTFKQIRGGEHAISRGHKKENLMTINSSVPLHPLDPNINSSFSLGGSGKIHTYKQPAVDFATPSRIIEVKNSEYSIVFEDSFINQNTFFSTSRLNKVLGTTTVRRSALPYSDFTYINFNQRLYPKFDSVGAASSRARPNALFSSWRNNSDYRSARTKLFRFVGGQREYLSTNAETSSVPDPMVSIGSSSSGYLFGGFESAAIWPLDGAPRLKAALQSYQLQTSEDNFSWVSAVAMYKDSHNFEGLENNIDTYNEQVFKGSLHLELDSLGSNQLVKQLNTHIQTAGVLSGHKKITQIRSRDAVTSLDDYANLDTGRSRAINNLKQFPKISYASSMPIFKTVKDILYATDKKLHNRMEQSTEESRNRLGTENYRSPLYRHASGDLRRRVDDNVILADGLGPAGTTVNSNFVRSNLSIRIIRDGPANTLGTHEYIYDTNNVLVAILKHSQNSAQDLLIQFYVDGQGQCTDRYGVVVKENLNYFASFTNRKLVAGNSLSIDTSEKRRYCFTNIITGNDQKWTANLDHPIGGPNYDSYEEYSKDIKPIAKDYSILPEFRIHNFANEIITSSTPAFKLMRELTSSKGFLELPETIEESNLDAFSAEAVTDAKYNISKSPVVLSPTGDGLVQVPVDSSSTSSNNKSFYREYTTTELMRIFDMVESNDIEANIGNIKLRAKGVKKFLPYNGFYPVERTAELATHFASSYYGTFQGDTTPGDADLSYSPWLEALMSPGILYNTIKSSLAVDYPIHTRSYKLTAVSPFVVNHKQIGMSPTDYEYDVAPIAIRGPDGPKAPTSNAESGDDLETQWRYRKESLGENSTVYDNMFSVNDSPYKPTVGIGFIDPPIHNFRCNLEWHSSMMDHLESYKFHASQFYNQEDNQDVERFSNYGRLMSCGNMYSPYYYKKYYTEEERSETHTESVYTDYSGSFVSPVRYALGSLDGTSDFGYRIPFEAVIDPEIIPKNLTCVSSHGWHQEGYLSSKAKMSSASNARYTMASSNFFAECIDFFLEDSKISSFRSKSDADADFGIVEIPRKGYEYRMRFVVVSDPEELKALEDTSPQDYLDVVSGYDVEYHTGPAYRDNEFETPNESFHNFLISYFDRWDYKKGASYDSIKDYHGLSDIQILGLNYNFRATSWDRDFYTENHYHASGLLNAQNNSSYDASVVGSIEPQPGVLLLGTADWKDTPYSSEEPSLSWFSNVPIKGSNGVSQSKSVSSKGLFNISGHHSMRDPFAGGFEFYIHDLTAGKIGSQEKPQTAGANGDRLDFSDADNLNTIFLREGDDKHETIPGDVLYSPTSVEATKKNNFSNFRNVYIETDEAFWISPPTTIGDLYYNYNMIQILEPADSIYLQNANLAARPATPFGTPNILSKAMSMKGLGYLREYVNPGDNKTRESKSFYSVGPTIGNILDTNDIYAALYEYTPFNINLAYYFAKAGSDATTSISRRKAYTNTKFVLYNNKTAFGHPCVSLEGWNTLHFPQFAQNLPTNSTARVFPNRRSYSFGDTLDDNFEAIYGRMTETTALARAELYRAGQVHSESGAGTAGKNFVGLLNHQEPDAMPVLYGVMGNITVDHFSGFSSVPYYMRQIRPWLRDLDFTLFPGNVDDAEWYDYVGLNPANNNLAQAQVDEMTLLKNQMNLINTETPLSAPYRFSVFNSLGSYRAPGFAQNPQYNLPGIAGLEGYFNLTLNTANLISMQQDGHFDSYMESFHRTAEHFSSYSTPTITSQTIGAGQYCSVTRGVQSTTMANSDHSQPEYDTETKWFHDYNAPFLYAHHHELPRLTDATLFGTANLTSNSDYFPWNSYLNQVPLHSQVSNIYRKAHLPRSAVEVSKHNNTLYDDHHYVGFLEPVVSYDFRPYTPPYYEGYCYVEYIFQPSREGKHTLSEIMEGTRTRMFRKRDNVKYANTVETEPYLPNYWHKNYTTEPFGAPGHYGYWRTPGQQDSENELRVKSYRNFLNPNLPKSKKVGSPNPSSVRLFPDLVDQDRTNRFTHGGHSLEEMFGLNCISDIAASEYAKFLRTTDDTSGHLPTTRDYTSATDVELLTYIPNNLKTSRKAFVVPISTANIIHPVPQSFVVDHTAATASVVAGTQIDLFSKTQPIELSFAEDYVKIQDNFEGYKVTGEVPFSWFDPYTKVPKFKQPLNKVFTPGAEVIFVNYIFDPANNGTNDGLQSSDFEENTTRYHLPVFLNNTPLKYSINTRVVKSIDERNRKVTLITEHGTYSEQETKLSGLLSAFGPAVSVSSLASPNDPDTQLSDFGIMIVIPSPHEETFGDYGFVPRFCGLDYPGNAGFLINESTWNRLNPAETKKPLYYDCSANTSMGRPITSIESEEFPNEGHFYDYLELSHSFTSPVTTNPAHDAMVIKERVVNWKVCPLVTEPLFPHHQEGVYAMSHGLSSLDDSELGVSFKTTDSDKKAKLTSPTHQGSTSYLFYRYNNRVDSRQCLNHTSEMNIDSSFNLFGMTNVENLEFDSTGRLNVIKKDTTLGSQWVISPKFEAPVLNFAKWLERKDRHILKLKVPEVSLSEFERLIGRDGDPLSYGTVASPIPPLSFNIHGPAVGIDTGFAISTDVSSYAVDLAAAYSLSTTDQSAALKTIRQGLADAIVLAIRTHISQHGDYRSQGGLNWKPDPENEDYPTIESLVYRSDESVVITGPAINSEEVGFNKGKFKIVNGRIPAGLENGRSMPDVNQMQGPSPVFYVPGGCDDISFFEVDAIQECGEYTHADRIEPESYKRRDSDIVPDPIVGIWHQEGDIPGPKEGLSMLLIDSPGEFSQSTSAEAVVSVRSISFEVGTGISLATPDGFIEKYINTGSSNSMFDDPAGANITVNLPPGMKVIAIDFDGDNATIKFSEQVASRLSAAINANSQNFTSFTKGSDLHVKTKSVMANANFCKIDVFNGTSAENVYITLLKQFGGAGQSVNQHGSLADLVGFGKKKLKPLGRLAEDKKVKEAVLAIPLVGNSRNFVHVSREMVEAIQSKEPQPNTPDSLVRMVESMDDYVLPPHMDFLNNDSVDPFLVFVLEFEHTFTKQDLADIWQNLYPRDSSKVEILAAESEHNLNDFPKFEITPDTRWLIFKVKQKAKKSYFNKVSRSVKNLGKQLANSDMDKLFTTEEEPTYSYNWPYDYFSLIELFKMSADVEMTNGDIPSFEEYMSAASQMGAASELTPSELVAKVESASTRADKYEKDQARKEELARAAAKKREEARKAEARRRPRVIQRPIYRSPEGYPRIITNEGATISLNVGSEGSYYYTAFTGPDGIERLSSPGVKGSYKVTVVPTATYDSEGSTEVTSTGSRRRRVNRNSEGSPEGY